MKRAMISDLPERERERDGVCVKVIQPWAFQTEDFNLKSRLFASAISSKLHLVRCLSTQKSVPVTYLDDWSSSFKLRYLFFLFVGYQLYYLPFLSPVSKLTIYLQYISSIVANDINPMAARELSLFRSDHK